jgi:hypothetical protein
MELALRECPYPPVRTISGTPIQGFGDSFVDFPEFRCASLRAILLCTSGAFRD